MARADLTTARPTAALQPVRRRGRHSMARLLGAILLLIAATPFFQEVAYGGLYESIILTLVLLSALFAIGARRTTHLIAFLLVLPAVAGRWLTHVDPDRFPPELFLIAGVAFTAFVIAHLLIYIVRAVVVDTEVICAAVATFFLIAMLWAFGYLLADSWIPDAFSYQVAAPPGNRMTSFEALYFSLSTLTTVDFGDIIPVSRAMRIIAMLEGATGIFYMAILVSRLVGAYSSAKR